MSEPAVVQALHAFVMCNPHVVAPLSAIPIVHSHHRGFVVDGDGVTLDARVESGDRMMHDVAEGVTHAMLGHPARMVEAREAVEYDDVSFGLACRVRAHAVIGATQSMPNSMFTPDPAMSRLVAELVWRGAPARNPATTLGELHDHVREAMADAGFAERASTIAAVVRPGRANDDMTGLIAIGASHARRAGSRDVVVTAHEAVGRPLTPAEPSTELMRFLDAMEAPGDVEQAHASLDLLRKGFDLRIRPYLLEAAMMEGVMKTLRRKGVPRREIHQGLRERAKTVARGTSGDSGKELVHINLDVEAAPMPVTDDGPPKGRGGTAFQHPMSAVRGQGEPSSVMSGRAPAPPMRLFHWNKVTTCENHATGDVVVMAPDLATARERMRAALHDWLAENREWPWLHGDAEDRAELEAKVEADVASEPALVTDEARGVVLRGSE